MGCNCKTLNNEKDFNDAIDNFSPYEKLTFFKKVKYSYIFAEFYFYFVTTSIINFFKNDIMEPRIPKRVLKKLNSR